MPTMRPQFGLLCTLAVTAAALTAYAQNAPDDPPPIPYGMQETIKLNAIVDAAPFMAPSPDRVVTLKQERLRVCVQSYVYKLEAFSAGRHSSLEALAEPLTQMKTSWVALCTDAEQKMPMLEFVLQTHEWREQVAKAMFDDGRASADEMLGAKRDRLSAEIEMIECQRVASGK